MEQFTLRTASKIIITACIVTLYSLWAHALPITSISYQELYSNSTLLERKLLQAARQGFFYLEMAPEYQFYIPHAVHFGNTFYKDPYYRTLQLPGYSGYKDRETAQAEGFYCRESLWQQVYAPPIVKLAQGMQKDSATILSKVLALFLPNIAQQTLEEVTGGLMNNNGLYHLSYKHYRPEMNQIGLPPHKDFGHVTILYIDKPGLHAKIDGIWHAIPPKENHFIVNFGNALELLINDNTRLNASWHYVEQITLDKHGGDRICFALFSDNNLEMPLYQRAHDGTFHTLYATYKEYVDDAFKVAYGHHDLSEIT